VADYLTDLFALEGKTVAVTGGGGYLCGEMSRSFARAGMNDVVLDLRLHKAEEVAEQIRVDGGSAVAGELDVTDSGSWRAALDLAVSEFGAVDVLVNGAGYNAPTPFFDIPLDEWRGIIDSHVTGTMLGCQVFGRQGWYTQSHPEPRS